MSPTRSCTTATIYRALHLRPTAARTIPSLMTGAATDLDIEIDIDIDMEMLIVPSLRRSGFHDDHADHADHADDCFLNDYFLDDVLPHSLSFLKKGPTTDLRLGAAASAVGTFSGCSTHNL